MGCKAKSCKFWKSCAVKRACCDDRCWDYKRDPAWKPKQNKTGGK